MQDAKQLAGRLTAGPGGCRMAVLGLALLLAGCALPREINPFVIYDEITGEIDAGRVRPPGLDRPFPSLGSVPARPDRPDARSRNSLTDSLEADRGRSREPLAPRAGFGTPADADAPGTPLLPAAPPLPPRLAGAVVVPWGVQSGLPGAPVAAEGPGMAPEPGEVPAGPTPDLLAAPPPVPGIR